jgi:hypothetical protein
VLAVLIGLIALVVFLRRRHPGHNYERKNRSFLTSDLISDSCITDTRCDLATEQKNDLEGPLMDTVTFGASDGEDLEELL